MRPLPRLPLVAILALSCLASAVAGPLPTVGYPLPDLGPYLVPNELYPRYTLDGLRRADATPGAVVSVGTERGFMTFGVMTQATELLLVDYDPRAVLYNQVNIALLAVSSSLEDYLSLRNATSKEQWLSAPGSEAYPVLRNDAAFAPWHDVHEYPAMMPFFLNARPRHEGNPFHGFHYPTSVPQYERLATAARTGRITVGNLSFADHGNLELLRGYFEDGGTSIAVLDLSNAASVWDLRKMRFDGRNGAEQLRHIVEQLVPVMNSNAVLITTEFNDGDRTLGNWEYTVTPCRQSLEPSGG